MSLFSMHLMMALWTGWNPWHRRTGGQALALRPFLLGCLASSSRGGACVWSGPGRDPFFPSTRTSNPPALHCRLGPQKTQFSQDWSGAHITHVPPQIRFSDPSATSRAVTAVASPTSPAPYYSYLRRRPLPVAPLARSLATYLSPTEQPPSHTQTQRGLDETANGAVLSCVSAHPVAAADDHPPTGSFRKRPDLQPLTTLDTWGTHA